MQHDWNNFAKSGIPNGSSLPAWQKFTPAEHNFQPLIPPSPMQESAETNRPVSLAPVDIVRRPDTKQEISKAPTTIPPQLVKADAPGAE
jgi:carboxylesterase type B